MNNGLRVFIAGPYTVGDVAQNVRSAMSAAMLLLDAGHYPFVPHLSHFLHLHEPRDYQVWIQHDLAFLEVCDALIRLPGKSNGADNEVIEAKLLGIEVHFSVEEFLDAVRAS